MRNNENDNDEGDQSMASQAERERIEVRAYQLYLGRGGGHGLEQEDWLQAEREILGEVAAAPGGKAMGRGETRKLEVEVRPPADDNYAAGINGEIKPQARQRRARGAF